MRLLRHPLVRVPLVLVAALTLQVTVVTEIRVFGVSGDLLLLLAIAAGIVGPPERAAVVGFAAGLGLDLVVETPFGLTALVYALVAYAVSRAQEPVIRATWWIPSVTAVVATALGLGLFLVAGYLLGERQLLDASILRILAVLCVGNALLIRPAVAGMRWAMAAADLTRLAGR